MAGRDAVFVGAGAAWPSPLASRLIRAAAVLKIGCLDPDDPAAGHRDVQRVTVGVQE
jgi:hypothetical protein